MSGKNLPPLCQSTYWTRDYTTRKPSSPPRCLPPLQPLMVRGGVGGPGASRLSEVDSRIASLQNNIQFLQQQHKETLETLHAEVEYLKKENKELKYKLIMESKNKKGMMCNHQDTRSSTQGSEDHTGLYQDESHNYSTIPLQNLTLSSREDSKDPQSAAQNYGVNITGRRVTSLHPLRIHSNPSHPPRPPTLKECEDIIQHLFNANSLQSQEIARVKALLRDMILSNKITSKHISSKAYLVDGPFKSVEEKKFPKLSLHSFPEKVAGPSSSGVVLPPLKQSRSSSVANRQSKTRAVQKHH